LEIDAMFVFKGNASTSGERQASAANPSASARARTGVSIIAADLLVCGTLESSGDLQIDGRIDGEVRGAVVVIGDQGEIRGKVFGDNVTVRGKVIGCISAAKIVLSATSQVSGDISNQSLSLELGAFFEGSCRQSGNPRGNHPDLSAAPVLVGARKELQQIP
jgi:cytoskeletal protein CcmA (bactofilin family)